MGTPSSKSNLMPHHLKLRKSSNSTPRKSTHSQRISKQLPRKQFLKNQRPKQFSKERRILRSLKMKLRLLALSSSLESRISKRRRVTKSPRRQRKTINPKSPAALTSLTETKPLRNSTARRATFRILKRGKHSSIHG